MRTWLIVCALAAGLGAAVGCQKQVCLVRDPPPPLFGPRVAGYVQPASPLPRDLVRSSPPPAPVRPAPWDQAGWDPGGPQRSWRFIVIHHSATPTGSAAEFDRMHKAKGWDELGYHFVIGNGRRSGNGQVEIRPRWKTQKHGAHCKVEGHPEYNDVGIGICLVGNFDLTVPTEAQMDALARLVRFMMDRYHIPRSRVFGHGQLKPTDCPGRNFDYADLWRRVGK